MRAIHYDMILSEPYHIGCNPNIHNFGNIQDTEAIKWPGMRMIVEDCDNIEKFYASFEYIRVDGVRPKFEQQMTQVLRGDLPEWKLAAVDVDSHELWLRFRNEALFGKYSRKCQAVNAWNNAHPQRYRCIPPQFYAESAMSYEPDIGARLRFELDDPVSGNTEVTIVSFRREQENSVIEFDGNKGRKFTFRHKSVLGRPYSVRVEEWMI